MPIVTATPARIRRVSREGEYARVTNGAILIANPDAKDGYTEVTRTFFDLQADAQVLLTEKSTHLMAHRVHIGAETPVPIDMGTAIAMTPTLPRVRFRDKAAELDRTVIAKGIAIDLGSGRNSIEGVG